jgi:exopolyphosphatase/guanosine-5'-triphosphate,3'-diphosphate pyrophosphatase
MEREIVRLGKGLSKGTFLIQERMDIALKVIDRFSLTCRKMGAGDIIAVGTSPLRNAANAIDFVKRVKTQTGIEIRILSGEEEGYMCLLGILKGIGSDLSSNAILMDVGGGSTEVICWWSKEKRASILSLPLGMLHLTETHISKYPPDVCEVVSCENEIISVIESELKGIIKIDPDLMIMGTAGTLTTLACIDLGLREYDPEKIHKHKLSKEALEGILIEIKKRSREEISKIPGMERGREDVILSGTLIVKAFMDYFGAHEIIISDWGLLEGALLEKLDLKPN